MSTQNHLDGLSTSVSSTPSSSVQPPELAQQENMMVNQIAQDPSMHGQSGIMAPGDVSMDGQDDLNLHIPKSEGGTKSDSMGKTKDKRERLSRACVACHTGKTRCSDSLPCQSCLKRGIASTCAYPESLDNGSTGAPGSASASEPPASRRRAHHNTSTNNNNNTTNTSPQAGSSQHQSQPQAHVGQVFTSPHVRGSYYDATISNPLAAAAAAAAGYPNPNGQVLPPPPALTPSTARRDPSPASGRPSKKPRYRNLSEQELASFTPKPYKRGAFFIGDSAPVTIDPRLPLRLLLADEERVDFFVGDGLPP